MTYYMFFFSSRLGKLAGIWVIISACVIGFIAGFIKNEKRSSGLTIFGSEKIISNLIVFEFPPLFTDELKVIEHHFPISNLSNQTVHILDLKASCSCAETKLADRELMPGEDTKLIMKVDLRGRTGDFTADCLIVHDGGEPLRCRLKFQIYQRQEFIPPSIHLGTVKPGVEIERNIWMVTHYREIPPPSPSCQLVFSPHLSNIVGNLTLLKDQSLVEKLPGKIFRKKTPINIRLTPPSFSGLGGCDIIATPINKDSGSLMRLDWFVENPYHLTPKRIFFESIKGQTSTVESKVKIKKIDERAFRIKDMECSCKGVTLFCETKNLSVPSHEIKVLFNPATFSSFFYGEVIIITDDKVIPRLSIPFVATR